MATLSEARGVKSLNTGPGKKRFKHKKLAQRFAEIDIDVYRNYSDPMKDEPSEGSTFFRDCLIEWRELNTAEDFISFYQETFPLVQTLPQIIVQKEEILSKLLSRLQMKCRLSLEPILRLIAALSRDLLEDFLPFLHQIVKSLVSLLKSGADREPEIVEQIFTSWSSVMMFLQRYLIKDVVHVINVTVKLRYYPHDDVQRLMAESIAFLLRNAPVEQVIKGIRRIMIEVVKKPSATRKYGASELLLYVMRGTSSTLHSRASVLLGFLLEKSFYGSGDELLEDSEPFAEVLISTFEALSNNLGPVALHMLWDCLYGEIVKSISNGYSEHLSRLLSLLVCIVRNGYMKKVNDYKPICELLSLQLQTYVTRDSKTGEPAMNVLVNRVYQLLISIIDGLRDDALAEMSCLCGPLFSLKTTSLLIFLRDLVLRDSDILKVFRINIVSALNDLVDLSEEETVYLLLRLIENLQMPCSSFLDGITKERMSKICGFVRNTIIDWIGMIRDTVGRDFSSSQFADSRLALLWGAIKCYPHVSMGQANPSLLLDIINALDELLMAESDSSLYRSNWQSLIGAALGSWKDIVCSNGVVDEEFLVSKLLDLSKKHRTCSQILGPIADILDSIFGLSTQVGTNHRRYHPLLQESETSDALDLYVENLCHFDPLLRKATLRILCHYEPLKMESSLKGHSNDEDNENVLPKIDVHDQVLEDLLAVEAIDLSTTSRKGELLLSRIQRNVSSKRINETYVPALLYGMIGIFHKQFSKFWDPAMECLSLLISQHFRIVWDRFIRYMDRCESMFLTSPDDFGRHGPDGMNLPSDLVGYFKSFVSSQSCSQQSVTVFSLLIKSLQRVPSLVESHSEQLIPLFLKFLGYHVTDLTSVELCKLQCSKRKEWKEALKEWLNLFKLMRKPESLHCSHLLKKVLEYRLLDETDPEVQSKALDCLLNWRDEYLVPYGQHLKDLINAKNLREELTTWSLSRESNQIDDKYRKFIVPIILRILVPKVRKLKGLASRKHASVQQRRAILGFLAELDVDELPLFFALLINPLRITSDGANVTQKWVIMSQESILEEFGLFNKEFTVESVKLISWRKRFGFLHVVEEVLSVFDESRVNPFLDLLMGCVVRILESCPAAEPKDLSQIDSDINDRASQDDTDAEKNITRDMAVKQFKELRSLCLKIISSAIVKYENHEFGSDFWNHFFIALRSLILHFKQVGASSEKPSSLFSCFLAMSRNFKLAPLLTREKNLVPDIFSMLEVKTASNAIILSVFKFVENLLNLALELRTEENSVEKVLRPHLNVLVSCLHQLFTRGNGKKRNLSGIELRVLDLLSRYIKETLEAKMFLDILLPLLDKKSWNSDSYLEILKIIQHVIEVVGSEDSPRILSAVQNLLTFAELEVRKSICDVLNALAKVDSDVLFVAKLLTELNAISAIEIDSLDYDKIIGAYEKINRNFFCTVSRQQALIVLSHCVYDMSSQELILRQSAYRLLLCFVEFAAEILEEKIKSDKGWTKELVEKNMKNFLLKHMGNAMRKETSIQKVWIDLLREMVLKLPDVVKLKSCITLLNQNPEKDFFSNIIHLQKHRRARALSWFTLANSSGNLPEDVTEKVFLPLFFNLLFGVQEGKGENVRSACLNAIASIAGCMSWREYYKLLMHCFRDLTAKREKQKILSRLISCILDNFHFSGTCMINEPKDSAEDLVSESSKMGSYGTELGQESTIQTCIHKQMLPKVQNLLISDPNNVNVTVCLVALKLLRLLPGEIMELQLRSIIQRICNFLTNRLQSVRDEARSALAACIKELGLEHLQFIVKILRGTLKRGFELHVLGFTLHFVLSKFITNSKVVTLDHCLEDLLAIIENDILGDVSEEKEVDKIASKMKETRKQKSYETLRLIAQNVTFSLHIKDLLSVITVHLQKSLTPKLKSKLEKMLNHIAAGIESNPSADHKQVFTFVQYELEKAIGSNAGKQDGGVGDTSNIHSDKVVDVGSRHSHLVTVFYLGLLQKRITRKKVDRSDKEHLSMLDPFISLLSNGLSSKYETVVSASLNCLSSLVTLRLPAFKIEADKIKKSLLLIAQSSWNAGSPLMESCLRLLTVLIRRPYVSVSDDQLQMLVQFPVFVDLERNPSFVCLSLLKAIVRKKLKFSEVYKLVKRVADLMVTCQVELIRKKCSEIILLFLGGYKLSDKLLQEYLDLFLSNLSYEHSSGREAVLEMIHAVIVTFDQKKLDEKSQTIFVHLVVSLANDHDYKVRSMTGAAIKLLIKRVNDGPRKSILEYSLSWYMGDKQHLWSAAAQVLGLLVEEVTEQDFKEYISHVFLVLRRIMKSGVVFLLNGQLDKSNESAAPFWKEAYYSLILLEKMLHKFQTLCNEKDLEDLWEMICEFLLHPHSWLRNISNRLITLCFKNITKIEEETHSLTIHTLTRPSRLFFIAASLCCQLRAQTTDDSARILIARNLDFAIVRLHLLLGQSGHVDFLEFWSNLEDTEQSYLFRAFHVLDPSKGKGTLAYLSSNSSEPHDEKTNNSEHILVSLLLKKMGKISLQMETAQTKVVFNCFKSISSTLLGQYSNATPIFEDDGHYAYQILLPLYKVCEGYSGRVLSDDVKQAAREVCESIQKDMGVQNFVQVYSQIRKNLKAKRDKRKREEKLMAVVNPVRNAKRKLRLAAKHRAYKKRKIMSMKMGRWV